MYEGGVDLIAGTLCLARGRHEARHEAWHEASLHRRDWSLREEVSALLANDEPELFDAIERALERQSVKTVRVRTCQEAARLLDGLDPPQLVFTSIRLPDGKWDDVLNLAANASQAVNVIVVARLADMNLYIDTLERGAFDFISPPLVHSDFAHILRCATENVRERRSVLRRNPGDTRT